MAETARGTHQLFEVWSNQAVSELTSRQAQLFKFCQEGQDEYLNEWQQLIDNWCKRRQKGVEDTWGMIQELQIGKDGADVVAVWERWMKGVIQRLADDSNDQVAVISKALRFWTAANGLFMSSVPDIRRARARNGNGGA